MANCPTVPLAIALERQTVPPVRVDSNRTVSSADTEVRTFTPDAPRWPCGLAPETLR